MNVIRKIPGFRSGKRWKMALASVFYLFVFLVLVEIFFGDGNEPGITGMQTQKIVTKPPLDMLPKRSDLSTEWVFSDNIHNIDINYTEFEAGKWQQVVRGSGFFSINKVRVYIYKFSSVTASKSYYENKTSGDYYLQRGGYKEVNMNIGLKCEAYKVDKGLIESGRAYCVSYNILFKVEVDSATFESEKHLKNVGKIVSKKISLG